MNTLSLQVHLAQVAKDAGTTSYDWLFSDPNQKEFSCFLKLLMLSYRYSSIFALAVEDPDLIRRLQDVSIAYANSEKGDAAREQRRKKLLDELSIVLSLHTNEGFWQLMEVLPNLSSDKQLVDKLLNWFRYSPSNS